MDVQAVRAGARFVTVLRVSPHEAIGARLMIRDPLPAGFEIDNPNCCARATCVISTG